MKRTIFTLAALSVLSATPAFASLADEVAQETAAAPQLVASPQVTSGFGTQPAEDNGSPAQVESVHIAAYPEADRPADRGN